MRIRKLALMSAVLVTGAIGVLGVGTPPAGAYPGPPRVPIIEVSSSVVVPGQSLTVFGELFTPTGRAIVSLHSTPVFLAAVTVDRNGKFAAEVVIPPGTTVGRHAVEALDVPTGNLASVSITVERPMSDTDGSSGGPLAGTGVATLPLAALASVLITAGALAQWAGWRRKGRLAG